MKSDSEKPRNSETAGDQTRANETDQRKPPVYRKPTIRRRGNLRLLTQMS